MTWNETDTMNEKVKFISAWLKQGFSIAELCRQFNITRKTGYKIIQRYEVEGVNGLHERSRAHYHHPKQIGKELVQLLLQTKLQYPHWGPRKIKDCLELEHPNVIYPAASTIGELFKKHGMVQPKKKRLRVPPHSAPFIACTKPNASWSADFKGQFKLGTNEYCYPLTVSDNFSRYFLGCKCLISPNYKDVRVYFEKLFKKYGLPIAIKTDNGTPFASVGIGGLSMLSIWFIKLGITPERIKPGHPEQNGRHERMHRTLKQEATIPAEKNLIMQQKRINKFICEYNTKRPHEALGKMRPADVYQKSSIEYPSKLPEVHYSSNTIVKKVRHNGYVKFAKQEIYIGTNLKNELVGLKQLTEAVWQINFSMVKLGLVDLKQGKVLRVT